MELYLSEVNVDWEKNLCTIKIAEDNNDTEIITLVLETSMANSMASDILSRTDYKAEKEWKKWKKKIKNENKK